MTAEHTAALAELEQLCFSRPWSRKALVEELSDPSEDRIPTDYSLYSH